MIGWPDDLIFGKKAPAERAGLLLLKGRKAKCKTDGFKAKVAVERF